MYSRQMMTNDIDLQFLQPNRSRNPKGSDQIALQQAFSLLQRCNNQQKMRVLVFKTRLSNHVIPEKNLVR